MMKKLFSADVIGFVKCMGTLEEYRRDSVMKNKLQLIICDLE